MLRIFRDLVKHLSRRRQKQFVAVLLAMLGSGVLEFVSVGSVFPFIAALSDPDRVAAFPVIRQIVEFLDVSKPESLVLLLAIGFATTVVVSALSRLFVMWLTIRFTVSIGADLAHAVFDRTLSQPYRIHTSRNSSEVVSATAKKVDAVANGIIREAQNLVYSGFLASAIAALILVIQPLVGLISMVIIGGIYLLIAISVKSVLQRNSQLIARRETKVVQIVQEGLGGVRQILLDGTKSYFTNSFGAADRSLRLARGTNVFISSSPRLLLEAVGLLLISMTVAIYIARDGDLETVLPVVGTMAVGAYRLLPALQQAYSSWSNLQANRALSQELVELLNSPADYALESTGRKLSFHESFGLRKVDFCYEKTGPWTLQSLDLNIARGSKVGILGETGSGKSTVLDLLMGLQEPANGNLIVDGQAVEPQRLGHWRRHIAHVPQEVFLVDGSYKENIAFGLSLEDIDENAVLRSAEAACILEFVENDPNGFDGRIGERGALLSGGQRQRLGIARALYRNCDVLILDEATSALDEATEAEVMGRIVDNCELTVIVVTHRASTLAFCDDVYRIQAGTISAVKL
jgi:ABC-type bacteriocin/lantibiotic exporter with double-glycine peptidase domain